MKLAVLLLCHEAPELLAGRLSLSFYRDADVKVYIHYDARRPAFDFNTLRNVLPADLQCSLLTSRVACRWGEYSLVEATRRLMQVALSDSEFTPDYLLLTSGSCVPIRPLSSLQAYLRRRRGIDFIQAHDIVQGRWVNDGLEAERFAYYFPFNFITQRKLFERATAWQQRMGVKRRVPPGLRIHFGSQWFCLTQATSKAVVAQFEQAGLRDFLRHSWIPDEFAIQTLVAAVQRPAFIAGFGLTYYEFDDAGRPLILDNGHEEHLARQPFFFARKLAPEATQLITHLSRRLSAPEIDLSYFDRIGKPSIDYRRFISDAATRTSACSFLGTIGNPAWGPMEVNRRRFYVLIASSVPYLLAVLRAARRAPDLPIFDFLFDRRGLQPVQERNRHFGLQAADAPRRDHDPATFLLEAVQLHPTLPTAFALDAAQASWLRDHLQWNGHAIIVDCDPPGLTRNQCAAAGIVDALSLQDPALLQRTRQAALAGQPLPRSIASVLGVEGSHKCQLLRLADADYDNENPVVRAVFDAVRSIDAGVYYPGPDEADQLVLVA